MAVITHAQRRSNLSKMIDTPGGVSVGVALNQARANLAGLEARSREIIQEQVTALAALPAPIGIDETALDQAYSHASAVIDAAGPFELNDLCAAAANLCDLIDAAPEGRAFDWRVVTVHAQALRLLLTLPSEAADARAKVLDSLKDVLKAKVPGAGEPEA